jgi:hypothetical protein
MTPRLIRNASKLVLTLVALQATRGAPPDADRVSRCEAGGGTHPLIDEAGDCRGRGDEMSSTPLPEHGILRAGRTFAGLPSATSGLDTGEPPEDLLVEETIIDVPDDEVDPERAAVVRSEDEEMSEHLDSGSEFDVREQAIVIPEDDDERASS